MQKILIHLKDHLFILIFAVFILGTVTLVFAETPAAPVAVPADTLVPPAPSAVPTTGGAPVAAQASGPAGGVMGMVLPFALMFLVLYLFVIRPQNKKMKDHQGMIGSLQHGDDVVTQSGILGKVTGITDRVITLEIAQNVKVKMLKDQVSKVLKGDIKDLA